MMTQTEDHSRLPLKVVFMLLALAVLWGGNWAMVKIGSREIPPVFMAFLRSVIASACLAIWIRVKGLRLFPSAETALHGLVSGLLFAAEFALIYLALQVTMASRVYVILYTAPFFTALGAHFFLQGDRLTGRKSIGLILAFTGIATLFIRSFSDLSAGSPAGDLMVLGAGACWGGLTVYIKKFLAGRVHPLQTLFYNIFFSVPFLLAASLAMENRVLENAGWIGWSSLIYQSVVVAFMTYLVWTVLIHNYPVSLLHSFSFFTPICGVLISSLVLGEPLSLRLFIALAMVGAGLFFVNRPAPRRPIVV